MSSPAAARPVPLQLLPRAIASRLYARHYAKRHAAWPALFERAPLAHAPSLSMHDLRQGDVISGWIAFTGEFEPEATGRVVALSRAGGLFVDVGANMGYFSLLWTAGNPANRAVAIEASPRIADLLTANVARNGLGERIEIVRAAAADRAGTLRFDPGPADQTGWGGIVSDGQGETIEVPAFRLDERFAGQDIAVLKIDVEGADALVLRGAEKLLREKRIGTVLFEDNPSRSEALGLPATACRDLLEQSGYRCHPLAEQDDGWYAEPA